MWSKAECCHNLGKMTPDKELYSIYAKYCSYWNTVPLILQPGFTQLMWEQALKNRKLILVTQISSPACFEQHHVHRALLTAFQSNMHFPIALRSHYFRELLALLPCRSQSLDGNNRTSLLSVAPSSCRDAFTNVYWPISQQCFTMLVSV